MHDQPGQADKSSAGGGRPPSQPLEEEPLKSVRLHSRHRVGDFECAKSARVQSFLRAHAADYERLNYARVFAIENPHAPDQMWGYYTLTAAFLERSETSTQIQKRIPPGLPVPLVRIGYMGRDDKAPRTLGAALVVDAARRVYRNSDIAAWGLILDAEGANPRLMTWYESVGFKRAKTRGGVMYAPFKSLIPELN